MATHFKGPLVVTEAGSSTIAGDVAIAGTLAVGSGGAAVKAVKSGTVSLDPGTLAAGAETDLTATIAGVAAGDIVIIQPPNAAAETGLAVGLIFISAANTVKVRCSNLNAVAALVGGAQSWTYIWIDLT